MTVPPDVPHCPAGGDTMHSAATSALTAADLEFLRRPLHGFLSVAGGRDWERVARDAVGVLRVEVAKNPYDRELSNFIGELCTRSDAFRTMWAAHNVHVYTEGIKRFRHPVVGDLELIHESLDLPGDDGLSITVYSADPRHPGRGRFATPGQLGRHPTPRRSHHPR
jgi:hypothetical protein